MIQARRTGTPHLRGPELGACRTCTKKSSQRMMNKQLQATTGETASQVHAYLGEATILKTASPFKYWSSTQIRFPALAQVARKYLTAPCTRVDSERLFSAVSHVIDEKRNRIHCNNTEMLTFVQKNLLLRYMDKGKN
ncbi:unnamed protein product [Knipowitschia caucasica]